jgi:Flp pilus assembly protein TadG
MEFPRKGGYVTGRLGTIRSDKRGGALVEFALTLPILLLTITGIFSLSIAIYQKLELAEAVASGGRTIAAARDLNDPCAAAATAISSAAPTLNSSNISISISLNSGTPITGKGSATCAGSGGNPNPNMTQGGTASVSASYPCSINAFRFSFPNCTIASTIVEEVQ